MVTVYSKPDCVQCVATYKGLKRKGVTYEVIDITEDREALNFARSLGDYASAPIVYDSQTGQHWSGFKPDRINALTP